MEHEFDEAALSPPDDPVSAAATDRLGIPYLYPYQRFVVAGILDCLQADGQYDASADQPPTCQIVILPTGAGKSLCFQLPAILNPGPTVVVYPLLGLMADQERRLQSQGIACLTLRGGMTAEERDRLFADLEAGRANFLITNPETLANPPLLERLAGLDIGHFVIDEAHCVAEWGDSFRPAYLELGACIQRLKPRVTTAFTATASPAILSRLVEVLFAGAPYRLVSANADRPNLRYEVRCGLSARKLLRDAVRASAKPLIVFVPSRSGCEITARDLKVRLPGLDVKFYHAGLERDEKTTIEQWFLASRDGVLCATCAYGMGMDKPDIRTIIHAAAPGSVEAYLQEAGRAGRDGREARAILLNAGQTRRPANQPLGNPGDQAADPADRSASLMALAAARAQVMQDYASQHSSCRRSYLLRALGAPDVACAGCDVCAGGAVGQDPDGSAIRAVVSRHRRRFTLQTAGAFLAGSAAQPRLTGHGALSAWQSDEIDEALQAGLKDGSLVRLGGRLWKNHLVPGRPAPLDRFTPRH